MSDESPRELRRKIASLRAFQEAYEAYLHATSRDGSDVSPEEERELRRNVSSRAPAAEEAMTLRPFIKVPPMAGGYTMHGLANVVFAHETTPFLTPPYEQVLDAVDGSIAAQEERLRKARQRRRTPLYWLDRLLRAVLGFPAYLLGIILRMPSGRIEESPWGAPLRVAALATEVALIIIGGREVGWW